MFAHYCIFVIKLFSNGFILIKVVVDPEPILGTLGVR